MNDTTRDPWDSFQSDGEGGVVIHELNSSEKRNGLPQELEIELQEMERKLEAKGVKPCDKWW